MLNLVTIMPQAPHGLGATSSVPETNIGAADAAISAADGLSFLEPQPGKSFITIIPIISMASLLTLLFCGMQRRLWRS